MQCMHRLNELPLPSSPTHSSSLCVYLCDQRTGKEIGLLATIVLKTNALLHQHTWIYKYTFEHIALTHAPSNQSESELTNEIQRLNNNKKEWRHIHVCRVQIGLCMPEYRIIISRTICAREHYAKSHIALSCVSRPKTASHSWFRRNEELNKCLPSFTREKNGSVNYIIKAESKKNRTVVVTHSPAI